MGTKKIEEKQKKDMQKKKRKYIVLFCIIGIFLMLIIGFFIGKLTYKLMEEKGTLQNVDLEILHKGENQEEGGDVLEEENQDEQEPEDTVEPTQEPTKSPNISEVDIPYYIKVNYGANTVTIYKKDSKGKYTVPVKAMICSTGTSTPTEGVYPITDKYTWRALVRQCIWTICM